MLLITSIKILFYDAFSDVSDLNLHNNSVKPWKMYMEELFKELHVH